MYEVLRSVATLIYPMLFVLHYTMSLRLRPQKVDRLFLRHFFEKTNARGRIFFYCVRLFFSCFSVDSSVRDCVIAYTLPLITTFFSRTER